MKITVEINIYTKKLFSDDKTKLIEIMLVIRKLSLFVALYFLISDLRYGPLYIFWIIILCMTPGGLKFSEFVYNTVFQINLLTYDLLI